MKTMYKFLMIVLIFYIPLTASAAIINYDFQSTVETNLGNSASFTESGVTIEFYAYSYLNSTEGWIAADIVQGNSGLG